MTSLLRRTSEKWRSCRARASALPHPTYFWTERSRSCSNQAASRSERFEIAAKQSVNFTRGSAASVARSVRDQVAVVRLDPQLKSLRPELQMRASHEPVGKLERAFDFGPRPDGPEPAQQAGHGQSKQGRARIASAVNMIDTLTAKHTLVRKGLKADRIEFVPGDGSPGPRLLSGRRTVFSIHFLSLGSGHRVGAIASSA